MFSQISNTIIYEINSCKIVSTSTISKTRRTGGYCPCNLKRGGKCMKCLNSFTKTTNIFRQDGNLLLVIPDESLYNGKVLNIMITQEIPDYAPDVLPIAISVNSTTTKILAPFPSKIGNKLYTDQLKQDCVLGRIAVGQVIKVIYAIDTASWNYLCNVCPSGGVVADAE